MPGPVSDTLCLIKDIPPGPEPKEAPEALEGNLEVMKVPQFEDFSENK